MRFFLVSLLSALLLTRAVFAFECPDFRGVYADARHTKRGVMITQKTCNELVAVFDYDSHFPLVQHLVMDGKTYPVSPDQTQKSSWNGQQLQVETISGLRTRPYRSVTTYGWSTYAPMVFVVAEVFFNEQGVPYMQDAGEYYRTMGPPTQ